MDKKNTIYSKEQIFLFFSEALIKLLERREIFVLLNKLYVFFVHIFQVTYLKLAFAKI